jgi:hypothetical protein
MSDTDDDPVANWQERISGLRKGGRVSGAARPSFPPMRSTSGSVVRRHQKR